MPGFGGRRAIHVDQRRLPDECHEIRIGEALLKRTRHGRGAIEQIAVACDDPRIIVQDGAGRADVVSRDRGIGLFAQVPDRDFIRGLICVGMAALSLVVIAQTAILP